MDMKTSHVATVICYIMQASDWSGLMINPLRYQDNHDSGRDMLLVPNLEIRSNMSYGDTMGLYRSRYKLLNKPWSLLELSNMNCEMTCMDVILKII
jgi:hypothetical protein